MPALSLYGGCTYWPLLVYLSHDLWCDKSVICGPLFHYIVRTARICQSVCLSVRSSVPHLLLYSRTKKITKPEVDIKGVHVTYNFCRTNFNVIMSRIEITVTRGPSTGLDAIVKRNIKVAILSNWVIGTKCAITGEQMVIRRDNVNSNNMPIKYVHV